MLRSQPVDKKDLICEEGEDLLLHLRYDPPFRSRSLLWDRGGMLIVKNNLKMVRMSLRPATGQLACVKNDDLHNILISFFY